MSHWTDSRNGHIAYPRQSVGRYSVLRSERDPRLLEELAELVGVAFGYRDGTGTERTLASDRRREFLELLGYPVSTDDEIRASIETEHQRIWLQGMPPTRVLTSTEAEEGWDAFLPEIYRLPPYRLRWVLHQEDGALKTRDIPGDGVRVREHALVHGRQLAHMELPPPPVPPVGYHRLELQVLTPDRAEMEVGCTYIVTPSSCYLPPIVRDPRRGLWGLTADLYALRSETSWGIGDLHDLATLVREGGRRGASLVALNPLHLIWNRTPQSISPYYPVSRLYRNPLYLNLPTVPEFEHSGEIQTALESDRFRSERRRIETGDLVDYDGVASLKTGLFRHLYETFMTRSFGTGDARDREFAAFRSREGTSLRATATFLALRDNFRQTVRAASDWRHWPPAYHRPDSDSVEDFIRTREWEIRFHEYVQWCLDDQLAEAAGVAREAGMSVGLLNDLAVGSDPAGADVWTYGETFLDAFELGAPPDAFNLLGQTWGAAPLDPRVLRNDGFAFFIKLIRASMRHVGAIRIDHILGFFRSFWVIRGRAANTGAYVRYPAEDLLKILALESHRNHTLVIGEDLGIVTPEVREALERFQILSSRLLYFERQPDGAFPAAETYPRMALVTATTHDLPTLTGWWNGRDLDVKRELGLYPHEGAEDAENKLRWERGVDRWWLLCRLHDEGLLPDDFPREPDQLPRMTEHLRDAVWAFLGRTPGVIVAVGLPDVVLVQEQQNVPGTLDQSPNWRRRLPVGIEDETFLHHLDRAAKIFERLGRAHMNNATNRVFPHDPETSA